MSTLITHVPPLVHASIARLARQDDRSITAMTRKLVVEALQRRGELPTDAYSPSRSED
jgi:hypothetical protein